MVRPRELPDRARVVIVGGGVGGASIAYHLTKLGERDVVLLDRNELTSGSTFHSAGLVGQLRSSLPLTRMMMDSVELYRTLDCGWVECGGIRLACTPEREQEVLRQVAWAKTFGLPLELISAEQAQEMFPLMDTTGVRCGSYLASDGYLDPSLLTTALADGARTGGAQIFTHTRVESIDVEDGRARGVQTEWGPIEAEVVVNAGGMFAAEIGRMAGVRVPIVPFAHEYLVTQPFRDTGGRRAPADPPRPRPADLLPRGGRGADHGRLRARLGALGAGREAARRHPPGLQRASAGRGLAALRGDRGELAGARAGDGSDHGHEADQRPRGVHPRQRVLPRGERGSGLLRRGRLLRPRPRGGGRHRQGRWPSGSSPASRPETCGRWTSAASGRTTARRATR